MPQYPFLSDEWIHEARVIRDEYAGDAPTAPPLRMNLLVTDVPFGTGTIEAHVDSTGGQLDLEKGHLTKPEVSVTTDYATTKALLVDQNPAAAMQAFLNGKIRVQGDLTKLMAMQPSNLDDAAARKAQEIAARIKAMTE